MIKSFQQIALAKGKFLVSKEIAEKVNAMSYDELYSGFEQNETNSAAIEFQGELMHYGKIFDEKAFKAVALMTKEEVNNAAEDIVAYLQEMYGDSQKFTSLFGNFPNTVLSMPEYVMFLHTIVHYLSGGEYSPSIECVDDSEQKFIHQRFDERVFKSDYQKIQMITTDELCSICKSICNAQQSLNAYDKEVVEFFCKNYKELTDNYTDCFPEKIPFKETLCIVAYNLPEYKLQTVTDVLRLAAYMSGIDISLPAIPKTINYGWRTVEPDMSLYNFKKFNRSERRLLLQKIEDIFISSKNKDSVLAEMKMRLNKWIRLGEILHPGEYKTKYPETYDAYEKLRNAAKFIKTFAAEVDLYRKNGDLKSLLKVLSIRPGEFARNLDWVIRKNVESIDDILQAFNNVLPGISMKLLYELINHFSERNEKVENRRIFIKGHRSAVKIKNSVLLDEKLIEKIVKDLIDALGKKFAEKDSLEGKIYAIDETLQNIALPTNMRSMNNADGLLPRGSKLPIKTTTGKIRLYCRWLDPSGHYDLDLSTVLYKDSPKEAARVSWNSAYQLTVPGSNNKPVRACMFSGDVRHRRGACAEYIDMDLDLLQANGFKYLVAYVNDFDGQGFLEKDAYAGVMEINKVSDKQNDVTWHPESITTGFKLSSSCTNIIMTVVDIVNRCMYVVDEDRNGIPVSSYDSGVYELVQRYVSENKRMTVFDVIALNTKSRGAITVQMSHERILEKKAEKERVLKQYQDKLNELHLSSIITPELLEKEKQIEDSIKNLNNMEFVLYEDVAASYTNIFEWMF